MSDDQPAFVHHHPPDDVSVVHIAGIPLQIGAEARQRCIWCGFDLLGGIPGTDDAFGKAVAKSRQRRGHMHPGSLVRTTTTDDGESRTLIGEFSSEKNLPLDCCAYQPPEDTADLADGRADG